MFAHTVAAPPPTPFVCFDWERWKRASVCDKQMLITQFSEEHYFPMKAWTRANRLRTARQGGSGKEKSRDPQLPATIHKQVVDISKLRSTMS